MCVKCLSVDATEINGGDKYPEPPVTIPIFAIVPAADTVTLNNAFLGTWYPVPTPTSNSFTSVTYESSTFGTYTKVGRQVTLVATMKLDNLSVGSASGNLVISGIPFTALDSSSSYSGSVSQQDDWNEFPTQIFVRDDDTLGLGYKHADGDDQYSVIEVGDMDTSGGAGNVDNRMRFTVTYFTA